MHHGRGSSDCSERKIVWCEISKQWEEISTSSCSDTCRLMWQEHNHGSSPVLLPLLHCHRSGFQWLYILLHGDVGVFAALFGGTTIHSAAHFNKSRINEQMKDMARWCLDTNYWQNLFFQGKWQLDKQLKRSRDGMIWLLSGDFNQLKLIYAEDDVIYSLWENTINSHISSSLITLPWNAPNACFACLPTESEMA